QDSSQVISPPCPSPGRGVAVSRGRLLGEQVGLLASSSSSSSGQRSGLALVTVAADAAQVFEVERVAAFDDRDDVVDLGEVARLSAERAGLPLVALRGVVAQAVRLPAEVFLVAVLRAPRSPRTLHLAAAPGARARLSLGDLRSSS